jgi:choline dehydrogenase
VVNADVVVIGAGSSGAVVAARLVESGIDVVLVEAGPDYGPLASGSWPPELLDAGAIATTHDWNYASGTLPGRSPITFERARVMGGCSSHNGAIAAVGHASDYDGWGLDAWRTDALRPLFATALEKMRVRVYQDNETGPFHRLCLEAAEACGWPIASDLHDLDANTSFGLESVNIFEGIRWNTAFAYLDPVRADDRLRIVDRALVDRVEHHASGATVHIIRDGARSTISAETVVLSAGVYGTPAILQRSGIGDADRLRAVGVRPIHDLPGVGANLHDHPMLGVDRAVGHQLQEWLDEAAARVFLPEEQTLGKAISSQATDGLFDLHIYPVCAATQTHLTGGRALIEVCCVTPQSRGRVDITSADPEAHPHIDHRYLSDPAGHDLAVIRDGIVMAEELFNHPALARVLGGPVTSFATDDDIRREIVHYYHPVGTCPMGTGAGSVCDERGRVHGLPNLVVADVSLMPQIPRANTNIPAVVIGERIAQLTRSYT